MRLNTGRFDYSLVGSRFPAADGKNKETVMNTLRFSLVCLIFLLAVSAFGQEIHMPAFPSGVGRSVGEEFFRPYFPQLEAIADTLKANPKAAAVITGTADGVRYPRYNDAMNPGLALGRAQALADLMMLRFGVDSAQLQIQARTVEAKGPEFRTVSIRVQKDTTPPPTVIERPVQVPTPVPEPAPQPVYIVDSVTIVSPDNFRLHFGAGMSTSPFGAIPIVSGAVSWRNKVYLEGIFGHAFWNGSYRQADTELDTKDRMIAGMAVVYPFDDIPLGGVAGWVRIEEIANDYHEYTRLSEGLMVGFRVQPIDYVSFTGLYNPSSHRDAKVDLSSAKNGQILLMLMAHLPLGGK